MFVGELVLDDGLCEEVWILEIGVDEFFEGFFVGFGDVGVDFGGDVGVVYEGVDVVEVGEGFGDEVGVVGFGVDVGLDGEKFLCG